MSKILIISDKKPGHTNQSIAFAEILELKYDILNINTTKLLKLFSYVLDFFHIYINIFKIKIPKNEYKAVVSAGSSTYYINKLISKKLDIKSIAIMYPRGFRLEDFDYIIANEHDEPKKLKNIIKIPINLSINKPKGILKRRDKKAIGIIIGGDNQIFKMKKEHIKKALDEISKNYPNHLIYITTSRRTPKDIEELLDDYEFEYKLIYSKHPDINPIPDFIEVCDEIFITMDSTSMISEVKANSNATLHIIKLNSLKQNTKYHKLIKNIYKIRGRVDLSKFLRKVKI